MGKFLRLVNGIARSFDEGSSPSIYDQYITVVTSNPQSNQLVGPISAGTNITLPQSKTYNSTELQVYLNGIRVDDILDYNHISTTQIAFTFDLVVGDIVRFYIDRNF